MKLEIKEEKWAISSLILLAIKWFKYFPPEFHQTHHFSNFKKISTRKTHHFMLAAFFKHDPHPISHNSSSFHPKELTKTHHIRKSFPILNILILSTVSVCILSFNFLIFLLHTSEHLRCNFFFLLSVPLC